MSAVQWNLQISMKIYRSSNLASEWGRKVNESVADARLVLVSIWKTWFSHTTKSGVYREWRKNKKKSSICFLSERSCRGLRGINSVWAVRKLTNSNNHFLPSAYKEKSISDCTAHWALKQTSNSSRRPNRMQAKNRKGSTKLGQRSLGIYCVVRFCCNILMATTE